MTGFEAIAIIRNDLGLHDIFIAAYTAHTTQDNVRLGGGVDVFLFKPANLADIEGTLDRFREHRAALDARLLAPDSVAIAMQ